MAEKNTIDVVLYLGFWALYGPLAVAMWYYEQASLFKLGVVLLIGLGLILGCLFIKEVFRRRKKQATVEILEEAEEASVEPVSFDNVFKPDFGKVEIDLD